MGHSISLGIWWPTPAGSTQVGHVAPTAVISTLRSTNATTSVFTRFMTIFVSFECYHCGVFGKS